MKIERKIKHQTLSVLIFIIFGFGTFILYQVNSYLDSKIENSLKNHRAYEKKFFNKVIKLYSEIYAKRIDKLIRNPSLLEAFSVGDRTSLYKIVASTFKEFQKESKYIKILTFRSPDGTAFLRVHKPEMFGDAINKNRKIILDTNRDKKRNYGFEVGKLKMTYRIVTPIFKGTRYLGLVEFGIEPEAFMNVLKDVTGLKYALAVRKDTIKVMIKDNNYVSKNNYSLISKDKVFIDIFNTISIKGHTFFTVDNRELVIDANLVLRNHKNNINAYFLTIDDRTDDIVKAEGLKKSLTAIIVISMFLILIFLNYIINFYIKSIKNMFYTDELTGLANRNSLVDELKNISENSALFLIDINAFKTINELYGVKNGNDVLKQMGEVVRMAANTNKMKAYRISSDEFVLFAYKMLDESKTTILEKIYMLIKNHKFVFYDLDTLVDIDITIGSTFGKDSSLEKVDMALKHARLKHLDYVVYSQEIDTKKDTSKIIQVKNDIRYALENNNIVPFFQPIVDKEGNIIKYEALMRMIKLDGGEQEVISPYYFLDLSFKFNLYPQLSKTIIEKSFEAVRTTDKQISMNLAPSDILDNNMSKYVLQQLKNCKKPSQIIIEITENEDIKDFKIIKQFITDVKEAGAKIAIDDFGSGYANYSNIFELQPDYIKIDGTLIKDIVTNKENQIFVKTIINLSKEIGVKTIAEFVHSKEVFELVKSYGVDEFQGYYFGQAQKNIE